MAIDPVSVSAAYRAGARIGATGGPAGTQGGGFGAYLTDAIKDAATSLRAGETAAAQGAAGQGDIVQVVNAVTKAELTLETVVAIRDKVIAAYQDIMKMPI